MTDNDLDIPTFALPAAAMAAPVSPFPPRTREGRGFRGVTSQIAAYADLNALHHMPRKPPREHVDDDLAAELGLFPDLVKAFWPDPPPPAIAGSTTTTTWWSQLSVADGRPLAASGEILDREAHA